MKLTGWHKEVQLKFQINSVEVHTLLLFHTRDLFHVVVCGPSVLSVTISRARVVVQQFIDGFCLQAIIIYKAAE